MSEQECLTCGEMGHTYVAHWGFLGLSPALTPGFIVTDGPKPPGSDPGKDEK